MQIKVIASSSRGNGYLISDSHSTLLIECGVNVEKIQKHIPDLTKIDGCLITHEHNDHSKSAKEIINYTKVYASSGTVDEIMERQKIKAYQRHEFETLKAGRLTTINTFKILPFGVQHDAIEPLGFLIYSKATKKRLLFATDTYYIKPRFKNLNYIMIECNYSKDLLPEDLEKPRKDRLLKSHFELENVKKFLLANDLKNVEQIYLMHLSKGHSDAERFKKEIQELTGVPVIVCEE